jgi:hypothetical protein
MRISEYLAEKPAGSIAEPAYLPNFKARPVMDVGESVDPHKAQKIKEMT